jgi:hypothetical protein
MLMRTRVRARGKVAVIAGFSLLWSKDVVANTLKSLRNGAVGFIDWLGDTVTKSVCRESQNEGDERHQ